VWDQDIENPTEHTRYVKRLLNQGGENTFIFKVNQALPPKFLIGVQIFSEEESQYAINFSTGKKISSMGEDYYTRLSVGPEDKLIFSVSGENLRVALNELDLGLAFRSNELATEKCRIFTSDHRVVSLLEGRSLEAAAF